MNYLRPVELSVTDGVATILLARPGQGNALDLTTATALADAVQDVSRLAGCRALLLRGQGRHFCVGGDAKAMSAATDPQGWVLEVLEEAHRAIRALSRLQVVIVAAVQGAAAGAGLGLALAADLVVCADDAQFVTAYAGIGLTPDAGVSWMLPRVVGHHRAMSMLVGGTVIDGRTAQEWGLAYEVVPAHLLDAHANKVARGVADQAHEALGGTRRLVGRSWSNDLTSHLDEERDELVRSRGSSQQWLDAFVASRTP